MTRNYNKYELAPFKAKELTSIVFKVEGSVADEAHVGLFNNKAYMSNFDGNPFYEIIIGGSKNTVTAIHKTGQPAIQAQDTGSDLISSEEFRSFWVSWEHHVIAIGRGSKIGNNLIVSLNDDPSPLPVNYVGFSSGHNNSHTWKFSNGT